MKRGPFYEWQTAADATFIARESWALPDAYESSVDELLTLQEKVGLVDLTGWGVLQLRGSSRLDFVQRLSTNDVLGLASGQGAPTVFTTPIGRIIDLGFVLVRQDDLLLLVGRGADVQVADWLKRHIFFNDDVVVERQTEQWGMMGYLGPGATALASELVGQDLDPLPPFHWHAGQIAGVDVTVVHAVPLGEGFAFLAPADRAFELWQTLAAAARAAGGGPVGEQALETARVGAGWPRFGRELSEDYIPLEAGLQWAVSFEKGCYVGQEIIARMESRQRLAKRLVVLQGSALQQAGPGDALEADGSPVGQVTSVAPLADQGETRALAFVKTGVAEPGQALTLVSDGTRSTVTVEAFPGSP